MIKFLLPLAFLAEGVAFPAMVLFERAIPRWPTAEVLAKGMEPGDWYRRPYHYLKNIMTECVRADAQYWGKLLCFTSLLPWALLALWSYFK